MSVNRVQLLGNVGKDPELKQFDGGNKASFSLATTERGYVSKTGETIPDRVTWHNIVCWRGLATIAEKYIKKGTQIYLEGKITTRSWEKDGTKHYMTEIVADNIELLGGKDSAPVQSEPTYSAPVPLTGKSEGFIDDLPF